MKNTNGSCVVLGCVFLAVLEGCTPAKATRLQLPPIAPDTARDVQTSRIIVTCEVLILDKNPVVPVLERDIDQTLRAHHVFLKYLEDHYSKADFDSIVEQMMSRMVEYKVTDRMKKLKDPDELLNSCRNLLPSIINLHQ